MLTELNFSIFWNMNVYIYIYTYSHSLLDKVNKAYFWCQDRFIPNIWRISFSLLLTVWIPLKLQWKYSFIFILFILIICCSCFFGWIKSTWIKIDMKCVELHSCDGWPFIIIMFHFLFIIVICFLLNPFLFDVYSIYLYLLMYYCISYGW